MELTDSQKAELYQDNAGQYWIVSSVRGVAIPMGYDVSVLGAMEEIRGDDLLDDVIDDAWDDVEDDEDWLNRHVYTTHDQARLLPV